MKPAVQFQASLRQFSPTSRGMMGGFSVFSMALMVAAPAIVALADGPSAPPGHFGPVVRKAEPYSIVDIEAAECQLVTDCCSCVCHRVDQKRQPEAGDRSDPLRSEEDLSADLKPIPDSPKVVAEAVPVAHVSQASALMQPELSPPLANEREVRGTHDPGIKPMSAIGTDITPPLELDTAGTPLRSPEDGDTNYAAQAFSSPPPFPRDPTPNGLWFSDAEYGPPLNFCYRPLYFEESNLERYGRTAGILQPLLSAGSFYGNAAILPYRLTAQRPGYCTYYDHPFRPGAPAPWERQRIMFRSDAATVQAAVALGLIFLIP